MKCEPLIKDVSYSENVVKLPTKPLTVNPHPKPSSVEGRDSSAPRSRAYGWRLEFREMEVTSDRWSDSRHSQSPCGGQEFSDHFLFFPSYPDSVHRICLVTTGVEMSRSGSHIQCHFVLWIRHSVLLR